MTDPRAEAVVNEISGNNQPQVQVQEFKVVPTRPALGDIEVIVGDKGWRLFSSDAQPIGSATTQWRRAGID